MAGRVFIAVVLLTLGCSSPAAKDQSATATVSPRSSPATQWIFMAEAAAPVPAGCSAQCTLDCDVWSGALQCGEVRWSVYGGLTSMAGMQLDQAKAQVLGRESLRDAATMRWGLGPRGDFCVTIVREGWNWELCGPDRPNRRDALLSVARGYTRDFPKDRVISCVNSGC